MNVVGSPVIGKHFGDFFGFSRFLFLFFLLLGSGRRLRSFVMGGFGQVHGRGVMLKNFMVIVLDAVVLFGEGSSVVLENVVRGSHRGQMFSVHVVGVVRFNRHSVVV